MSSDTYKTNHQGGNSPIILRGKTDLLDNMYRDGRDKFYAYFQRVYDVVIGAHDVDVGVYSQLWAATEPKKERLASGGVYFPVGKKDCESKFAKDDGTVDSLWQWTEKELAKKGYWGGKFHVIPRSITSWSTPAARV